MKPLNETELNRLKQCILEIYQDILWVCKKYDMKLLLCGGSALGAVRHQGFIPWDDDMDLMLLRKDYDKFISIFQKELGEKYLITAPKTYCKCKNAFVKVYKKNTLAVEYQDITSPYPKGVFVDIFPLDYVSNRKIKRRMKGFAADILSFAGVSVYLYQYQNNIYRDNYYKTKKEKNMYDLRCFLGKILSFWSHKKWLCMYDHFIQGRKPTNYVTMAPGRMHYYNEVMPVRSVIVGKPIHFEGLEAYIPKEYQSYLKHSYGNYMVLPPVEKREHHYFYRFHL